jgi:DNA-binding response OmpR family regulator
MALKILVADDEKPVRELLSRFLSSQGYQVLLAANGVEALEIAGKDSPQLIILDVCMPDLDGIKACRRLRTGDGTQSIPIIVLTGYGGISGKVCDAGADNVMMKPACMAELSHLVRATLHLGHQCKPEERSVTHLDGVAHDFSNWSANRRTPHDRS